MVELKIIDNEKYIYNQEDKNEKKYILNLEFLDINEKPKKGDYIYINSELLNKQYDGYSTSYTFGSLESKYGKENISMDDVDVIKVVISGMEIYLKRLYGQEDYK